MNNSIFDDAEEAPVSLNGMLAGFDENTSAYAHMPTKNPNSHFCFALNIKMTEPLIIGASPYARLFDPFGAPWSILPSPFTLHLSP